MAESAEVVFNGMGHSEFIEDSVRKHIKKVEKRYNDISNWRVAVTAPHKSHRHGNQYELNIRASVPGEEIVVSHTPGDNNSHDDMRPVIRDAFLAFESQMEKRKGKKHHMHRTARDIAVEQDVDSDTDIETDDS